MQNYNEFIGEPREILAGGNSAVGLLTSAWFDVAVAGIATITLAPLIAANIIALFREDAPWQETTDDPPGNRQYEFDDVTGDFIFNTVFNPNEKIFAIYRTGAEPPAVAEPVTLAQFKNWLRQEGFPDEDASLSVYTGDDDMLTDLLVSAREELEQILGISIVAHAYRQTLTNLAGYIELQRGPVNGIASMKTEAGVAITDYVITGECQIKSPCLCNMIVEYYAGYGADCPQALKTAILKLATWDYINRGNENARGEVPQDVLRRVQIYNRRAWLQ